MKKMNRSMKKKLMTGVVIVGLLAGCTVGPKYRKPIVQPPSTFRGADDAAATPDPNSFSVIELRVNRTGQGEGKTSLTTKVTFESATKSIALENYAAQPVILKGVTKK